MGDEEAGLRGRVDAAMLSQVLPQAGPSVRTVVCGPPEMLDDVQVALQSVGHKREDVVALKAFSQLQTATVAATEERGPASVPVPVIHISSVDWDPPRHSVCDCAT